MEWLKDNYAIIIANDLARSLLIIISAILIAKITDLIFIGFFKKISSRTVTKLDD